MKSAYILWKSKYFKISLQSWFYWIAIILLYNRVTVRGVDYDAITNCGQTYQTVENWDTGVSLKYHSNSNISLGRYVYAENGETFFSFSPQYTNNCDAFCNIWEKKEKISVFTRRYVHRCKMIIGWDQYEICIFSLWGYMQCILYYAPPPSYLVRVRTLPRSVLPVYEVCKYAQTNKKTNK